MSQSEGFLFDAITALKKAEYALIQLHAFHMIPGKDDEVFGVLNKVIESLDVTEKMLKAEERRNNNE